MTSSTTQTFRFGAMAAKTSEVFSTDAPPYPGMVWIPGGTFRMGSDHHYAEEAPAHGVTVTGF
jgi:formylglycine-generating enzyme